MNSLIKCLIAVFLTGMTFTSYAQDLVHKIPSDALAVATFKGKNLTELMSLTEFNKSFTGKKILSKFSRKADKPYSSVDDLGFNLASSFYYYNQSNDSVTYNCFLSPVKNAAQVDALYTWGDYKFNQKGNIRSYYNSDSTEVAHWNNEMFLFVVAIEKKDYFSRPEVMERFGLTEDYPASEVVADTAIAVDASEDVPADSIAVESAVVESEDVVTDTALVDSTMVDDDSSNSFFKNQQQKKSIIAAWTQHMVDEFFAGTNKTSILNNNDFLKSQDAQAEATIWVSGIDKLFNSYMPAIPYLKGMSFFNGYGSGNAKFYLEDKSIRLTTSMTFSDEIAAVFKRVHQRKLNKRFLKYVNEDRMIGYMGYALDTKAYLEEYPKLMSKIYGSVYAEEIGMAADLLSLLLDEEAIGKVVKGDALFIFNGLMQNEVSYKSYEYNEDNFESKEVMKTKKETLPDFLLMISSEDTRLIDKLIAYGAKKDLVKKRAGYYELSIPKSPLSLYFTIKDQIIFFTTSITEIDDIAANSYVAKISGKHKKTLLSSNYSAYFSGKKLAGKIPSEEFGGAKKLEKANRVLNSLGDIYLNSNPIKGNVVSGQVSMDIPANQPNALKYLFSLIEDATK
ncbi:hypothetical protein [Pedobacter nyackensis]|uniref:DUF4836 family protein n=1 Tax=Pedobacter nyackensis TaxID=475255 RepID=A0A1W2C8X0_9SPHI|nr:hypothetical protein [Pedobacter nyackensis]SMC81623.1 hypothetical protein SAMN04488101_103234 [Pedobacter nyackensis]